MSLQQQQHGVCSAAAAPPQPHTAALVLPKHLFAAGVFHDCGIGCQLQFLGSGSNTACVKSSPTASNFCCPAPLPPASRREAEYGIPQLWHRLPAAIPNRLGWPLHLYTACVNLLRSPTMSHPTAAALRRCPPPPGRRCLPQLWHPMLAAAVPGSTGLPPQQLLLLLLLLLLLSPSLPPPHPAAGVFHTFGIGCQLQSLQGLIYRLKHSVCQQQPHTTQLLLLCVAGLPPTPPPPHPAAHPPPYAGVFHICGIGCQLQFLAAKVYRLNKQMSIGMAAYYGTAALTWALGGTRLFVMLLAWPMVANFGYVSVVNWCWHAFVDPQDPDNYLGEFQLAGSAAIRSNLDSS